MIRKCTMLIKPPPPASYLYFDVIPWVLVPRSEDLISHSSKNIRDQSLLC